MVDCEKSSNFAGMKCNLIRHIGICAVLLTVFVLLASCSGSDGDAAENPAVPTAPTDVDDNSIRLNANVWRVMEGTRAAIYDGGTLTSGSFTASSYVANTTTSYINPVQVDYVTDKWVWSDGKHYWPATGNLDFFAYMPTVDLIPSYITTSPTYSAPGSVPQALFVCTGLPMTYDAASPAAGQGSGLQEFVWGITVAQNKANQGATGVTMKFRHPFACLKFQLAASHPDIQINSITFKALKTGGTCTLNNTDIADTYYYTTSAWSSLTPAEGGSDLVMTLASKDGEENWIAAGVNTFNSNPASVVPIGGWSDTPSGHHEYVNLLVVPQTFAGAIEINASWKDWGDTSVPHTVTTTIPAIAWQAGYCYTYTFTITPEDLVVNLSDFTEQW